VRESNYKIAIYCARGRVVAMGGKNVDCSSRYYRGNENGDRFNEPEGELLLIFPEWKPVILGAAWGPRRRASAAGGENGQYNHKM
jgi:hypothetical protein